MTMPPRLGELLRALRTGDRPWVLVAGLLGGLLSLPLLTYHFAWDHGIYATIGDTLLRGGVAYRDAWEFRPPGVFYVYSAAFALLGRSEASVRALELLAIALSCAALARIGAARFGSPRAGLVAALGLPFFYVPLGHWNTAQCESFQLPFLLWAAALWPAPRDPEAPGRRCFVSGLLVGAVVLLKTPGLLFAPLFVLDRLLIDRREPTWKEKLRLATVASLGMLAPILAMLAYYGVRGALPDVLHALVVYAAEYASFSRVGSTVDHTHGLAGVVVPGLPIALLALLAALRTSTTRSVGEALRWLVLAGAAFAVVGIQGRYLPYHTLIAMPFAALAVGVGAAGPLPPSPSGHSPARRRIALLTMAGMSLAFAAPVASAHVPGLLGRWKEMLGGAPSWREPDPDCRIIGFSYEKSRALAGEIRARTRPSDRVFLWTSTPLALFLSDRRMAGPYSHLGMMIPYWEGPERLAALLERLAAEPPALIVTGGVGPPFQKASADGLLERHPNVRDFIARGYRPDGEAGPYRFWRLKD